MGDAIITEILDQLDHLDTKLEWLKERARLQSAVLAGIARKLASSTVMTEQETASIASQLIEHAELLERMASDE